MLSKALHTFSKLTKHPEHFLQTDNDAAEKIKNSLKDLYDFVQEQGFVHHNQTVLPKLLVDGFDDEQIWQELELYNETCFEECVSDVTNFLVTKKNLVFPLKNEVDKSEHHLESQDKNVLPEKDDVEDQQSNKHKCSTSEVKGRKRIKESVVDDQFFRLSDLNEFLNKVEKGQTDNKAEDDSETESINYFEDVFSDREEEEGRTYYNDFFDDPDCDLQPGDVNEAAEENDRNSGKKKKQLRFDLPMSDEECSDNADNYNDVQEEDHEDDKPKSNFEMRQERLKLRIDSLEEKTLSTKPWQMKGEVSAANRPKNSLLEEVLEFDMTTRPAPVTTEQTTMLLEDIIRQRIKDKVWDDVEKKVKPVLAPDEYKKQIVLNQEKSKLSLAQIYEQEYLKEKETNDPDAGDKPEEEPPLYNKIRSMMSALFAKLDALTNFHYTPKMVIPEVKIISNLPAITMEEVAPVASTDATLLAPENIRAKQNRDLVGKPERTKTDKNYNRRQKRKKQRLYHKEKEKRAKIVEKLRPGLGNKYSKEDTLETLKKFGNIQNVESEDITKQKAVRSSTAFFTHLQNKNSQVLDSTKLRKTKQGTSIKKMKL